MADTPSIFRLELGINLNSAIISRTKPEHRLFPLQNALIDITNGENAAGPSWYTRIQAGDQLWFRLVDISNLKQTQPATPPAHPAEIEFIFTEPQTGAPSSPFVDTPVSWQISNQAQRRTSPVYSLVPGQELATWDVYGLSATREQIPSTTFAEVSGFQAFELSVTLGVERNNDGSLDQFVFDPEMIVSERSG